MKKWDSYQTLFEKLNNSCVYLVLRNYEKYGNEDWLDIHDDIDFLCEDIEQFINTVGAGYIDLNDKIHMLADIGGNVVRIDIRSVGDGYYDELWQRNMLKNRKKYKDLFVMDDVDYFYSLIYHELYHKNRLDEDYINKLKDISARTGIDFEPERAKEIIDSYM